MSRFRLPDLPRGRSKTESSGSGIDRPSLIKPSSVKKRSDKSDNGASLQTRMFEFYDEILKEAERFVGTVQDEATAAKAKEELRMSLIPPGSRGKMTPEMFSVKARRVTTLIQRVEAATLRAPPTKPKQKRRNDKPSIGHLPADKLKLNIQSTIMAGRLQHYDVSLASPGDTELGSGCAIPLCLPNDMEWNPRTHKCVRLKDVTRKTLHLIPQAVDILRSISGPVCVVAIVGPCRSGKSYILSRLIGGEGGVCHFDLGHKMDPQTMGIWMWDKPFKVRLKSGEVVTMVLLDTEGIDAACATEQGDNQIFTLSVLLSSLLIYNSMGVPRRDDLSQMQYPC